ncbi:UDP-glucuronosyl/UDP-glucosyltransferase [Colletotrichum graminicola]|nr:UDP-glucuronosyl/UDP-glucosyltransferase [Colletotrichum graminicola]
MLPFSNQRRHSQDDAGEPDPEADQLIPTRKRRHRVRVQGRLAVVRSVSIANLRPAASVAPALPSPVVAAASATTTPATTPRFESGVAGSTDASPLRRRKSLDDASSDCTDEEDDAKETAVRDRQFRGYGIGGAGNIRRPTEVYGSTKPRSSLSRFSPFSPSGSADETEKKQWSFKELFARTGGRKGKGVY